MFGVRSWSFIIGGFTAGKNVGVTRSALSDPENDAKMIFSNFLIGNTPKMHGN